MIATRPDHPRSRGVYACVSPIGEGGPGSSPLARGLRSVCDSRAGAPRIIPARAGFTWSHRRGRRQAEDHPRSRGVYGAVAAVARLDRGSSPLARGLLEPLVVKRPRLGIIPARAGFTPRVAHRSSGPTDHPRSRGVYTLDSLLSRPPHGSSPLARGLHGRRLSARRDLGIIPARAGFTALDSLLSRPPQDHPRSRGVYRRMSPETRIGRGSSPLARGLRSRLSALSAAFRIIPARAGFTAAVARLDRLGWDHPRSRGVYALDSLLSRPPSGSSPLARGLPSRLSALSAAPRIIPARAGFTLRILGIPTMTYPIRPLLPSLVT